MTRLNVKGLKRFKMNLQRTEETLDFFAVKSADLLNIFVSVIGLISKVAEAS